MQKRPSILVFAGHDPTGGAGIIADTETINDLGSQPCSIITALTVQNSHNLQAFEAVDTGLIKKQFASLVDDISFSAIKIGMIGSEQTLDVIIECLQQLPSVPVIVDPVLAAGGGTRISNSDFAEKIARELMPLTSICTPNVPEAQKLSGKTGLDDCARQLLSTGCENIIITGTHADGQDVINTLYTTAAPPVHLSCQRLDGVYHGSGCTFASALSHFVAAGYGIKDSFSRAQDYTLQSLLHADSPGKGQLFPCRNRMRWST